MSQLKGVQDMMQKFALVNPNFTGPISPKESVEKMMVVIEKASCENGDGGAFISHHGNKEWL